MSPTRPPPLSRRRLLAAGATAGAAGLLGACSGGLNPFSQDDPDAVGLADLEGRDVMDLDALGLAGLRLPGADDPVAITIRGRRIASVDEGVADGVATLDLDGGYVVPGFTDAHVHLQLADPADVLAGGVTTVRDLGGPPTAAQAERGGDLRVLIAGRILTAVGGYPTTTWGADGTAREVASPEDAATAVDEQVAAGAVIIKVALEPAGGLPVLDQPTLEAIVTRAAELGLRTTAHVSGAELLERAVAAGVRELAHLPTDVGPSDLARAAEASVVVVPTLAVRAGDPAAIEGLRAFREAGGEVLYGTDLGNGGTSPGIMVDEVRAMQEAGMTPAEVLASATADAAFYLGLDAGVIEPARVADLVVLGGDPFADPAAYDDIRLVVANGAVVAGTG